jgi:hypothetical protein
MATAISLACDNNSDLVKAAALIPSVLARNPDSKSNKSMIPSYVTPTIF